MPTIDENLRKWDGDYHWRRNGERWSRPWGSPQMQWHASILPRIRGFVPAGTILEIAPGFGRWTEHLKDLCDELIAVDLAKRCVDACKERFAGCSRLSFHVNDGKSLEMVRDGTIDFAFSFDSLVHAEEDVLEAYIGQLAAKLKRDGVAFLHHSNIGQYRRYFAMMRSIPGLRHLLWRLGNVGNTHWRAESTTAVKLRAVAQAAGLHVMSQELVNWRTTMLTDCFSTFTPEGSVWARQHRLVKNHHFMQEARRAARLAAIYPDRRAA
jgi:SAM-dependent methyltransferase